MGPLRRAETGGGGAADPETSVAEGADLPPDVAQPSGSRLARTRAQILSRPRHRPLKIPGTKPFGAPRIASTSRFFVLPNQLPTEKY